MQKLCCKSWFSALNIYFNYDISNLSSALQRLSPNILAFIAQIKTVILLEQYNLVPILRHMSILCLSVSVQKTPPL